MISPVMLGRILGRRGNIRVISGEAAIAEKRMPLDARIADALSTTNPLTSEFLLALYNELDDAVGVADQTARECRARSIDPTCRDGVAERPKAEDQEFIAHRLRAAATPLRAKYQQTKAAEIRAGWDKQIAPLEAKVDALVREFRPAYIAAVKTIVDLLEKASEIDAEVRRLSVPGELYGKVDQVRGVEQRLTGRITPEFFKLIRLPLTPWGEPDAWPPKPRPVAYEYAACLPQAPAEVRGMSYEERVKRDQEIRRSEQESLARYYAGIEEKRIQNAREAARREAAAAERQRNGL
jgi:hypothetical protein